MLLKRGDEIMRYIVVVIMVLIASMSWYSNKVEAAEIKQGDTIVIITPETMARLCPFPNCGSSQHLIRILKGTKLVVEGIQSTQVGRMPPVKWFEVTYKGNKGWVSVYNTDAQ